MPPPPELTVVIVNYNAAAHIRRCLESLSEGCAGVSYEVIVVDNASPRPGIEAAVRLTPGVRLIRRRRNGGFAAGVNTGLRAARGVAVLVVNPDCVVGVGAAAVLLRFQREHPQCGVIGPRILNEDGTLQLSCRRFPSFSAAFFNRNSLLTRLLPGNPYSTRYLMSDWDHEGVRDVDWLSGAAMLLSREALARTGPFDERYFFEIEDVDLCRRMHDAGYRVVYLPEATVTHRIGGSSRTLPNRVILARHAGMWRYYRTYLRGNVALDAATGAAIASRCAALLVRANVARAARRLRRTPSPPGPLSQ